MEGYYKILWLGFIQRANEIKNKIPVLKSRLDEVKKNIDLIINNMGLKRLTLRKFKKKETKVFAKRKSKRNKKDNNDSYDS